MSKTQPQAQSKTPYQPRNERNDGSGRMYTPSPRAIRSKALVNDAVRQHDGDALNVGIAALNASMSEILAAVKSADSFLSSLKDDCRLRIMDTLRVRFICEVTDIESMTRKRVEHLIDGSQDAFEILTRAQVWVKELYLQARAWEEMVKVASLKKAIEKATGEPERKLEFQRDLLSVTDKMISYRAGEEDKKIALHDIPIPNKKVDNTFFRGELQKLLEGHRKSIGELSAMREALSMAASTSAKEAVSGAPPVTEKVSEMLEAIRPVIVGGVSADGEVLDGVALRTALNGRRPIKEVESKVDGKTVMVPVATIVDEENHKVVLVDSNANTVLEHELQA